MFKRIVNIRAHVHRGLSKIKSAIYVVSVEERAKAKAFIFKLRQREHFSEDMKPLTARNEIPKGSKILHFLTFLDGEGLNRARRQIGKSQLDFNAPDAK